MKKITFIAALAMVLLTGCGASAGSKSQATHAISSVATASGPVAIASSTAQLTAASACAQFRAAAQVMGNSSPTNRSALKRFGETLARLSSELSSGPTPYPRLSIALRRAGASVLAIAYRDTPQGVRQAYLVTGRYLGAVHLACAAKGY